MKCLNCGTENEEGSVFCKACGKKLGERPVCPQCGTEVTEDSVFCKICGAKLKPEPVVTEGESKTVIWGKVSDIFKIIASSAAIVTAAISLIFVFLIGTKAVFSTYYTDGLGLGDLSLVDYNLYYYFGKGYKEAAQLLKSYDLLNNAQYKYLSSSTYMPVAMGTVVSVLAIVSVCALFVVALVRNIKYLMGRTQKNGYFLSILTFLTFVAAAVGFLQLNSFKITVSLVDSPVDIRLDDVTVKMALSGVTVAGLALGGISAVICLVCSLLSRGKQVVATDNLAKNILLTVAIGFGIAALSVAALPGVSLVLDDMSYYDKLSMNLFAVIELMFSKVVRKSTTILELEAANKINAYIGVSYIVQVAAIALLAVSMAFAVKGLTDNKGNLAGIITGAGALTGAIVTLVCANNALNMVITYDLINIGYYEFYLIPFIALIVLAVIIAGVQLSALIVKLCYRKK